MKRYAILIGSSRFDKEPKLLPLRCPENDVDGMHEIISAAELGAFTDTFVFKNSDNQTVLNQIAGILSDASNEDQVLIYYSGHGKRGRTGQLYLTTTNTENRILHTTSIPLPSLREIFADSNCKKIALILDCCFAGAAGESFKSGAEEKLEEFSSGNGIYLLTASTANQTAVEKESDDYSLLTKHIINGIKSGAAARQGAPHISIEDIYNYVYRQVTAEGHQQPMRWAFNVRGEELVMARIAAAFGAQRLKDFRVLLNEIEEELEDDLYFHALRIVKENQPERDKIYLTLLNELYEKKLSLARFSSRWTKLAAQPSVPQQYPKQTQPIQKPKPAPKIEPEAPQKVPLDFTYTTVKLDQRGKEIERQQLQANQFIEELAPDINLEMVSIPGGTFMMGSDEEAVDQAFAEAKRYNKDAKREWFTRELPQHKVTVSPFYLGKFTITQEQWRVISADKTLKVARDLESAPAYFKDKPDSAQRPVEQVSWEDAEEFCARLAKKTGRAYRLPTEAEWEYACWAGTMTPFAFGETITPDIVNYDGSYPYGEAPKGKDRSETIPVGSLSVANAFGLFDMHGNVWEWCQDWYGEYEGKDLIDPTGVKSGSNRVLRGGSYLSGAWGCRAANRHGSTPDNRFYLVGFRCVISARTL